MSASALPLLSSVNFDADGISVWKLLLNAEKEALRASTRSSQPKYKHNLVAVRVLAFFLKDSWDYQSRHPFGLIPYKRLILELNSCNRVEDVPIGSDEESLAQIAKVFKLGLDYRNHLVRVFRSNTGPLPTPSNHASRPSWDQVRMKVIAEMAKAPTTKQDAKTQALCRDGYKCMISNTYDQTSCDKHPELLARAVSEGRLVGLTQVAHLFSESAQDNKPPEYAGGAFAILKMFGINPSNLYGGQINNMCNVMTLTMNLHHLFDNFSYWLEVDPQEPHTYDVCSYKPQFFTVTSDRPPRRVTFQVDPDVVAAWEANPPKDEYNKVIPLVSLPDPRLIAIRAACARVAHMSGAAEQADQLLEDRENTKVMADNGSTADLLSNLLLRTSSAINVGA